MIRPSVSSARYYLITGTIIAVPLLLGTVHFLVICAVGFLVALTAGSRYLVPRTERTGSDLLVLILLALAIITVLQAIPLPPRLLGLLSPHSLDVQGGALRPLGASSRNDWMPVSLDAGATWIEAAKLAIALLAYQNVRDLLAQRSRSRILKVVALAGISVSIIGILHESLGAASALYGLVPTGAPKVAGPFVNGNHQAGFLALAGAAAVGVALEARDARAAALWGAATVLIGVAGVLARSRAGTVAVVLAIVFPIARRLLDKRRTPKLLPFAIFLTGLAAIILSHNALIELFSDRDTSKIDIWRPAGEYIADYPLTGSGRGTFTMVYTAYQRLVLPRTFTHAENVPLQMVLDYGVIVGGLLVLVWLYGLKVLIFRRGKAVDWAIAGAALALFLHNLLDFNLEVLGVAIPTLAMLAARQRRESSRGSLAFGAPRLVLISSTAIMAIGLVIGGTRQLSHAEAQVRDALASDRPDRIATTMARVLKEHPADYFLPLLVADREAGLSSREGPTGRPLPWINRILVLYPRSFKAHELAARWFRAKGLAGQGLVEYRLALDAAPESSEILKEIILAYPRMDLLSHLTVGAENPEARLREIVRTLDHLGKVELADQADRALLEIRPRDEAALMRRAERVLSLHDPREVARVAATLADINPAESAYLRGFVATQENRSKDAVVDFRAAATAKPSVVRYWIRLAEAAATSGDTIQVREALQRAEMAATPENAPNMHYQAGWIWKSAKEPVTALQEFQRAADLAPQWKAPWEALLGLAEKLDRLDLVIKAKKHLEER